LELMQVKQCWRFRLLAGSPSNLHAPLQKRRGTSKVTPTRRCNAASGPETWRKRVLILPAIDLRGGCCVRLRQGDYAQETVFGDDPAAMARRWVEQGATFLHLVDLDGAREGRPVNGDSVQRIVAAAGVPCQLGGGLRSEADITLALSWGVARVVLGTRALNDPDWCEQMTRQFPGQIVLGIDARQGHVATHGWLETGQVTATEAARRCASWPLSALVFTDIGRDGMLQGPDVKGTVELSAVVPFPVIASGGVGSIDDLRALARAGVDACIVGRALYERKFTLAEAIRAVG
jgi:phosphoribosylformimino-5-aminoimidazole carboxamide ribotide isomerase